MKQLSSYLTLAVFAAACLSSCTTDDEFLKENPKAIYTIDNAYGSSSQVVSTLASAYAQLQSMNYSTFTRFSGTDILDNTLLFGGNMNHVGTWSTDKGKDFWDGYYQIIAYCNQALYASELETITWTTESEKKQVQAEARLLLGYAYLRLGEYFGGVPIVEEYSEELKFDYERSTRAETYAFAIQNLESAMEDLPVKPVNGRAAQGAAAMLLSEACLAMGVASPENASTYWAKAAQYAQQVIDIHPLMTSRFGMRADPTDKGSNLGVPNYLPGGNPYSDLFYKNNPRRAENTEAVWTMLGALDYKEAMTHTVTKYLAGVFPYEESIFKTSDIAQITPALRDVSLVGGEKSPWPSGAVSSFYAGPVGAVDSPGIAPNGMQANGPTWFLQQEVFDDEHNNGSASLDVRHKEGVSFRSRYPVTNPNHSRYGVEVYYGTDPSMPGWEDVDKSNQNIAFEFFAIYDKFTPIDNWGFDEGDYDSGSVFQRMVYRDKYMFRSAEAFLLLAEAKFRAGDADAAADALNAVRERAGAKPFAAGQVSLQVILDERARELHLEEDRWATFLRMEPEIWKERIYAYGTYSWRPGTSLKPTKALFPETQQLDIWQDQIKWDLWPIPLSYIDLNTGNPDGMKQNSGWGNN